MTTSFDRRRPATSKVWTPDKDTARRRSSRTAVVASMIAWLPPDIEQGRRPPAELWSDFISAWIDGAPLPRGDGDREPHTPGAARTVAARAMVSRQLATVVQWMPERREQCGRA